MNLADVYSFIDSKKRKLSGLLSDPGGTIDQYINQFKEDNDKRLNLQANAYPMAGDKTVLNSPHQLDQFRKQLAAEAGDMAMAGMFQYPAKSLSGDLGEATRVADLKRLGSMFGSKTTTYGGTPEARAMYLDSVGLLKATKAEKAFLYRMVNPDGTLRPRASEDYRPEP